MGLYTIGDPHLSLGCDKPMDVFKGWEDYVDHLEKHWQETVSPEDTVVIVGDISWGMTLEQAKEDFAFLHRLNGNKIMLRGNHDYWFNTKTKVDNFLAANDFGSIRLLFNNAFEYGSYSICGTRGWINEDRAVNENDKKVMAREVGRLRLSLESGKLFPKQPIVFLHYPPVYNTSECTEMINLLKEYDVKKCYYGHIHGAGHYYAIDGIYKGIDYRLVSCDYTQFRPVKVL